MRYAVNRWLTGGETVNPTPSCSESYGLAAHHDMAGIVFANQKWILWLTSLRVGVFCLQNDMPPDFLAQI